MIDTHTHLYLDEFDADGRAAAVRRAIDAGVGHLIFPNVDSTTVEPMLALHDEFPKETFYAMGLHPTEVRENWSEELEKMRPLMEQTDCVAVGEVGIDLYWDKTYRDLQIAAFRRQLNIAKELHLPVIIHCREALDEVLQCVADENMGHHRLVFHSFTGNAEDARRIMAAAPGAMFGINGVVTFKNARGLREAIPEIGLNRLLLETDSPYLAPVPHRGKRNESAYLTEVCRKVAEVAGVSPEEAERQTDANALKMFDLKL